MVYFIQKPTVGQRWRAVVVEHCISALKELQSWTKTENQSHIPRTRARIAMGKLFNWLHISDIHFHPGTEWRDGHVRDDLLAYLKEIFDADHDARPDLIFCTGDIAFGANAKNPLTEQYAQATALFYDLLKVSGSAGAPLAKDRLFLVPGGMAFDKRGSKRPPGRWCGQRRP